MSILNLAGQQLDVLVVAGDSVKFNLTFQDESGNAADLTGYTIKAQVREQPGVDPAINFQVTNNGNEVTLYIGPNLTTALPAFNVWDVQLVSLDQTEQRTLVRGAFRVKAEVTV